MMQVTIWIVRTIYFVTFIFGVIFIHRECKKQQLGRVQNNTNVSHTKIRTSLCITNWMEYLPILSLILITTSVFLMECSLFEYLCLIGNYLEITTKAFSWICIAYFQLALLYYVFNQTQLLKLSNNQINGYSNSVFVIVFVFGILLCLYFLIIPWFLLIIHKQIDNNYLNNYKCINQALNEEKYIFYTNWSILLIVIYDWIILSLYFIKMYQLKKISISDTKQSEYINMRKIYHRIRRILNKIVFLTCFYQLFSLLMGLIQIYTPFNINNSSNEIRLIMIHISIVFERILLYFVVILFIEHNDDMYRKYVLRMIGLCIKPKQASFNVNDVPVFVPNETPLTDDDDTSIPDLSFMSEPKQLNIQISLN